MVFILANVKSRNSISILIIYVDTMYLVLENSHKIHTLLMKP